MTSFYPSRFEEGCGRQSEQDSESVAAGQRHVSPVELGRHRIRQSIEDLKAEFQALIQETIDDARAFFQRARAGMQNPANKDMSSKQCVAAAPCAFPAKNAGVNAACEQSIQSPSGFSGVQTPSIYLTPAGGANPVHLNTGNYVTPELFSPANTHRVRVYPCLLVFKRCRCPVIMEVEVNGLPQAN